MTWWGLAEKNSVGKFEIQSMVQYQFQIQMFQDTLLIIIILRSLILYCKGPPCVFQDTRDNFLSQFKKYDRGKSKVLIWEFCVVVHSVLKISCPYQMAWIYESFISQLFLINLFFSACYYL